MNGRIWVIWTALCALAGWADPALASAEDLLGVGRQCVPPLHCPETDCAAALIANPGNAVEPKSGRRFFLDYPCDLKPGDKVTVVLALHGGGLTGNWQRHYFPIFDFKQTYRLVIATPTGTGKGWSAADDDLYLHNIIEEIEAAIGKANIKAFWLVGHSLGGQTANRLIDEDPFFRERLTGWVSLSGGRLGNKRAEVRAPFAAGSGGLGGGPPPALVADASVLPPYPFSYIYETGEREPTAAGLPDTSRWAQRLNCGPQTQGPVIVDARPGYVDDVLPGSDPSPAWGRKARPGMAQVYLYPNCADGRIVADIVRIDKGHTEGLEPHVAKAIVKLMATAASGR